MISMLPLFLAAALALPTDLHLGRTARNVIKADAPFEAAALTWNGDSNVDVRIRVSDDGRQWSDWAPLTIDDDITDRRATSISHFGAAKQYLEYEFPAAVDDVTVTLFPPSVGAGFSRPGGLKPAPTQNLTIRSRTDWGCPDGEASPLWTPMHTVVTH